MARVVDLVDFFIIFHFCDHVGEKRKSTENLSNKIEKQLLNGITVFYVQNYICPQLLKKNRRFIQVVWYFEGQKLGSGGSGEHSGICPRPSWGHLSLMKPYVGHST